MLDIIRGIFTPGTFYFYHLLAFIALFTLNLLRAKKYGTTKLRAVILTVLIYAFGYAFMMFLFWVETGVWGGQNIVRIFAWLPIITFPVGLLVKMDWRDLCDMIAPCLTINHGIAHFGCLVPGCCHGYPYDGIFAVYSENAGHYCFPIQPIEAVTALLITAFLLYYEYRHDYRCKGKAYAWMLILFGPTRFAFEFLRDNEKIVWGISSLAFHALFMTVVGVAALFLLPKYDVFYAKKVEERNRKKRDEQREKRLILRRKRHG